jgi:hypothetical protein
MHATDQILKVQRLNTIINYFQDHSFITQQKHLNQPWSRMASKRAHGRGTKNMIQSTMEREGEPIAIWLYLKQNMGWRRWGRRLPLRQHQQCAIAEIIGQMVQDPHLRPATVAIPAGGAKSSHFEIISISTRDRKKLRYTWLRLEYLEVSFRPINKAMDLWYTWMMTNLSQQLACDAIKKNINQYHDKRFRTKIMDAFTLCMM